MNLSWLKVAFCRSTMVATKQLNNTQKTENNAKKILAYTAEEVYTQKINLTSTPKLLTGSQNIIPKKLNSLIKSK